MKHNAETWATAARRSNLSTSSKTVDGTTQISCFFNKRKSDEMDLDDVFGDAGKFKKGGAEKPPKDDPEGEQPKVPKQKRKSIGGDEKSDSICRRTAQQA